MNMEITWMIISLCALVSWTGISASVSERYFLEDECGRTIDMQSQHLESVRVDLTKYDEYHGSFDCMLRVRSPPEKLLQVIIDRNEVEWSANCTKDYLQLIDGPELEGTVVPGASKLCSSSHVMSSYVTTGQYLVLRFKSDSEGTGKGFRLLVTAFRDADNDECHKTEFKCQRDSRCISEQLVCNKFQDCSDNSDECELSTAAVIGIAVASVVIVVSAVGIVVCWCCIRKRRNAASATSSTKHLRSSDVIIQDLPPNHVYQNEKADIHYYRPKTVSSENVYSTLPHMSHSPSGSFVVTGPHPTSYVPESQHTRQKWITVPPTTLQDADGNYFSHYSH